MDDNAIAALVALIRSTGFANASCHRNYDPPIVEVDLVGGLGVSIPYPVYEAVRQDAGLPEGICDGEDEE